MPIIDPMTGPMFRELVTNRHPDYDFDENSGFGVRCLKMADMTADESPGNYDIVGVATTDATDEDEEVILPAGADLSYINQTKGLYADHRYGMGQLVGKIRTLKMLDNQRGWGFRARMYQGLSNPLARDCFEIIKQGGFVGVSIGFDAQNWGDLTPEETMKYPKAKGIVRNWKWVELSLTAMPCNVTCYAMAAAVDTSKQLGIIDGLITKGLIRRESAIALGITDAKPRILKLGGEFPSTPKRLKLV